MKAPFFVATALVAACIVAACSSTPSRPPIQTNGSGEPGSGGGGGGGTAASDDSGTGAGDSGSVASVSEDGGVPIEGGASCSQGNCTGCCVASAPQLCYAGTTNATCGISGGICIACTAGFNCVNGTCQ